MKKNIKSIIFLAGLTISSLPAIALTNNFIIANKQLKTINNQLVNESLVQDLLQNQVMFQKLISKNGFVMFQNTTIYFCDWFGSLIWKTDLTSNNAVDLFINGQIINTPFNQYTGIEINSVQKAIQIEDMVINHANNTLMVLISQKNQTNENNEREVAFFQLNLTNGKPYIQNSNFYQPQYNRLFSWSNDNAYKLNKLQPHQKGLISFFNDRVLLTNDQAWSDITVINPVNYYQEKHQYGTFRTALDAKLTPHNASAKPYFIHQINNKTIFSASIKANNNQTNQGIIALAVVDQQFNNLTPNSSMIDLSQGKLNNYLLVKNPQDSNTNNSFDQYNASLINGNVVNNWLNIDNNSFLIPFLGEKSGFVKVSLDSSNNLSQTKINFNKNMYGEIQQVSFDQKNKLIFIKTSTKTYFANASTISSNQLLWTEITGITNNAWLFIFDNLDVNKTINNVTYNSAGLVFNKTNKSFQELLVSKDNMQFNLKNLTLYKKRDPNIVLASKNDLRKKLPQNISVNDVKPLLMLENQTTATTNNVKVYDRYGRVLQDNDHFDIANNNDGTLKFDFSISVSSWWNDSESKEIHFRGDNGAILNKFASLSSYFIKPNETVNKQNTNLDQQYLSDDLILPSKYLAVQKLVDKILDQYVIFAKLDNSIDLYPTINKQLNNQNNNIIILQHNQQQNDQVAMTNNKWITLIANDDEGTITVKYDFSNANLQSGLLNNSLIGEFVLTGFAKKSDFLKHEFNFLRFKQIISNKYISQLASFFENDSQVLNEAFASSSSSYSYGKYHFSIPNNITNEQLWNGDLIGEIIYTGPTGEHSLKTRKITFDNQIALNDTQNTFELNQKDNFTAEHNITINTKIMPQQHLTKVLKFELASEYSNNNVQQQKIFNIDLEQIKKEVENKITKETIDLLIEKQYDNSSALEASNTLKNIIIGNNKVIKGIKNEAFKFTLVANDTGVANYYTTYNLSFDPLSVGIETEIIDPLTMQKIVLNNNSNNSYVSLINNDQLIKNVWTKDSLDPNISQTAVDKFGFSNLKIKVISLNQIEKEISSSSNLLSKNIIINKQNDFSVSFSKNNLSSKIANVLENKIASRVINEYNLNNLQISDFVKVFDLVDIKNKPYKIEKFNVFANDIKGELDISMELRFFNPENNELYNTFKKVNFTIGGFISFEYEFIMWFLFIFATAVSIIILVLFLNKLSSIRNKKSFKGIK